MNSYWFKEVHTWKLELVLRLMHAINRTETHMFTAEHLSPGMNESWPRKMLLMSAISYQLPGFGIVEGMVCVCKQFHTQTFQLVNIIQLLTIEALDMMWYRPESTNIDRGGAEVNIGILRLISHHVQCLNSQQLFYYIISLSKKKSNNNNNKILGMDFDLDSLEFLFLHDD